MAGVVDAGRCAAPAWPWALAWRVPPVGLAMALGLAGSLGVPLLAGAAALFAGLVARVHVPHEEALLLARFGGWYRDYASSVRRWL